LSIRANATEMIKPRIMNAALYPIVFLVILQASCDEKKNSKFLNPIQGLFKKPRFALKSLKAIIIPAMGI